MSTINGITVSEVLSLKSFSGSRIVGGLEGLSRIITNIDIMEEPGMVSLTQTGELIITTGFSFKNDINAQLRLIPELAEKGVSALAIKLKRVFDVLPSSMIEAADFYSLPLIELSPDASYPDLLRDVYDKLLSYQTQLLVKAAEVHEKIMSIMLERGGLDEISGFLFKTVDNPVFIYSLNGDNLANYPRDQETNSLNDTLKVHTNDVKGLRIKSKTFELNNRKYTGVICPIIGAKTLYGRIVVLELNRSLNNIDLIAIEQAATLTAMTILQQKTLQAIETKYRDELLYEWLKGKIETTEELIHRASLLGWDIEGNFILIVIDIDDYDEILANTKKSTNSFFRSKEKIRNSIIRAMELKREYYIIGERSRQFVLLVRIKALWNERLVREKRKELASVIQSELKSSGLAISCSIGIGKHYPDILDLKLSHREAEEAIKIGRYFMGKNRVTCFEDLGVYRLLYYSSHEEIENFVKDTFNHLLKYDEQHNTELLLTLDTYFKCNGNISEISREMYTHYNTIVYRLERIKEILGVDIENPEHRLNLQVALKIGQMKTNIISAKKVSNKM